MQSLSYYLCGLFIIVVIVFYWAHLRNDQFEGVSVKENDSDIFLATRLFIKNFKTYSLSQALA